MAGSTIWEMLCAICRWDRDNPEQIILPLSIGVYEADGSIQAIQAMVDRADIARRTVKGKADRLFAFYDETLRSKLLHDKAMESQMESALEKGEFSVYYQPQIDAKTQAIVGAEALVRWIKPDGRVLPPAEFIPLFEANGFIGDLDQYVFRIVCEQQKKWLQKGLPIVPVSVNLSRFQLLNSGFITEYRTILQNAGIEPRWVGVEITESAMLQNTDVLYDAMKRLHALGLEILVDDFGTGYSSMLLLKDSPIDILKLDKSFVDDIGNWRGEKIISSIISLSKSLHIRVTAEGVETADQYEFLKGVGCDCIQGYYFARPMPENEFAKKLAQIKP